jgi:hypothetical protein
VAREQTELVSVIGAHVVALAVGMDEFSSARVEDQMIPAPCTVYIAHILLQLSSIGFQHIVADVFFFECHCCRC